MCVGIHSPDGKYVAEYFSSTSCTSRKAHGLLISYRVHGAHTLLIDVISYSNNDTAFFTPPKHVRRIHSGEYFCHCIFLMQSVSNTRFLYKSSCSLTIHQICAVDVEKMGKMLIQIQTHTHIHREMNGIPKTLLKNQCNVWEQCDMDVMSHILLLKRISWVSTTWSAGFSLLLYRFELVNRAKGTLTARKRRKKREKNYGQKQKWSWNRSERWIGAKDGGRDNAACSKCVTYPHWL